MTVKSVCKSLSPGLQYTTSGLDLSAEVVAKLVVNGDKEIGVTSVVTGIFTGNRAGSLSFNF